MFEWPYNLILAADRPDIDWSEYIYLLILFGLMVLKALGSFIKKVSEKLRSSSNIEIIEDSEEEADSAPRPTSETPSRPALQRLPVYARGRTQQAPPTPPSVQRTEPTYQPPRPQPTIRPTPPRPVASPPAIPRPAATPPSSPPPRQSRPTLAAPVRTGRIVAPKPQPVQTRRVAHKPQIYTAVGRVQQAKPLDTTQAPVNEPLLEAVTPEGTSDEWRRRFMQKNELANAIVMTEILGKPVSLREDMSGGLTRAIE